MKTDIEIAQEAKMRPITEIAAQLGLSDEHVIPYGRYKAKIDHRLIHDAKKQGKLILVTAISPTPAGEGKTTTSVGLADAMNALGKKTMLCLREPSLGPRRSALTSNPVSAALWCSTTFRQQQKPLLTE